MSEYSFQDRDEFNRKAVAEKIIKVLASDIDISTIVIDGKWGTGKTEFCKKLIKLSSEDSLFTSSYIDVYKYDHLDDPMLMLMGSISSLIPNEDDHKNLLSKAIPVVKTLGKHVAKAGVAWVLRSDADDIGESLADALADGAGDLAEEGIKELIESFEKCDADIQAFKSTLAQITEERKLVIFLDELDRCRPIFALSILEKIKHIFEVPNIKFVFTTNIQQLSSMVKKQYGHEIDAESYLNKFFSYTVKLPDQYAIDEYRNENSSNSTRHFKNLVRADAILAAPFGERSTLLQIMSLLIEKDNRSLRDVEAYVRNLKILNLISERNGLTGNSKWGYEILRALAVYVYSFRSDMTEKIIRGIVDDRDFSEMLSVQDSDLAQDLPPPIVRVYAALTLDKVRNDLTPERKQFWTNESANYSSFEGIESQSGKIGYLKKIIRVLQLA